MMMNLFSMFDPSSSYNSTSWVTILMTIPILHLMKNTMKTKSKTTTTFQLTTETIKKETLNLMKTSQRKGSYLMPMAIFTSMMSMNLMALMPHVFSPTAHASISLPTALTTWMAIMLYGWTKSSKHMMAHLTPSGTPNQLMNFMVIIETISNLIRPITLAVRLSANMVAGHLLMTLLSSLSIKSSLLSIASSIPMISLIVLEVSVAMIQAYVLTTLLTLYHNEAFKYDK